MRRAVTTRLPIFANATVVMYSKNARMLVMAKSTTAAVMISRCGLTLLNAGSDSKRASLPRPTSITRSKTNFSGHGSSRRNPTPMMSVSIDETISARCLRMYGQRRWRIRRRPGSDSWRLSSRRRPI